MPWTGPKIKCSPSRHSTHGHRENMKRSIDFSYAKRSTNWWIKAHHWGYADYLMNHDTGSFGLGCGVCLTTGPGQTNPSSSQSLIDMYFSKILPLNCCTTISCAKVKLSSLVLTCISDRNQDCCSNSIRQYVMKNDSVLTAVNKTCYKNPSSYQIPLERQQNNGVK